MSDDITKKKLYAIMATAEEHQKTLDKAIETVKQQQEQLEKIQDSLPSLAVKLFKDSLNDARTSIEGDLTNQATLASKDLKKASREAVRASQMVKQEAEALGWKHAFIVVGAIMGACLLVILGSTLLIPSLDDIAERRATVEQLNNAGGELQISRCKGELCVRVMTKQCDFGKNKDYCVLDLKD